MLELSQLWVYVSFSEVWHKYMYASKNLVIGLVDIGPFFIYMYKVIKYSRRQKTIISCSEQACK